MKKNSTELELRRKNLKNNILWFIDFSETNKTNFSLIVNIQYSFLLELLNEEKDATPMMIEKLCSVMGVTPEELYFPHLPKIYENTLLRNFGKTFRNLVDSKNISLKALSKATLIPASTLSQWYNSVMFPRPNYFDILSNYFKMPVSSFFANDSDKDYILLSIVKNVPDGKEELMENFVANLVDCIIAPSVD